MHRGLSFSRWDLIKVVFTMMQVRKLHWNFFWTFSVNVDRLLYQKLKLKISLFVIIHSISYAKNHWSLSDLFSLTEINLGNQFLLLTFFDSFTWWSLKDETVVVLGVKISNKQKKHKITSMPNRDFHKSFWNWRKISADIYFTSFWLEVQNQCSNGKQVLEKNLKYIWF